MRVSVPKPLASPTQYVPQLQTLEQIAQPVDQPAFRKRFSAAWQREAEIEDLAGRLSEEKASIVLVGDPGVGKTTLLVQAVHSARRKKRLAARDKDGENEPDRYRCWLTSAARLIAGMAYLGEWEQRCEKMISELSSIDGLLCADHLVDLVLLGGSAPSGSIAAFLRPYLQSGELRLVCEATPAELDACRRLLPGYADLFQVFCVEELKGPRARGALTQQGETRTLHTKVTLEEQAIETVCRLFHRFLPYLAMPGRASDFVAELFDEALETGREQVRVSDVVRHFLGETGLPEKLLQDDQPLDPEDTRAELAQRVIGQEEPCRILAEMIATFKVGLNDPQRPLGTFLFSGPTGVGKTELAKAISGTLFGHGSDTDRLIRLDMSEYSSPHTAQRFLTTEEGRPSPLIRQVRKQPFVVVLLDEIEKATAQVFDIMLGLLDEGRLTDRYGRTTNFCSAIIIMTSNLGTSSRQPVGFGQPTTATSDAAVRSFFRPEFFNRVDAVVNFQPLSFETCKNIVRKELRDLADREGIARANLRLEATDRLVERLANDGFDDRYGARPLQRTLETRVVTALSRYLIENPGLQDSQINLDVDPEGNVEIHGK